MEYTGEGYGNHGAWENMCIGRGKKNIMLMVNEENNLGK